MRPYDGFQEEKREIENGHNIFIREIVHESILDE